MLIEAPRWRRGGAAMEIGAGSGKPDAEAGLTASRAAAKRLGPPAPRQFFATAPVPCPYVGGRIERKLIVELAGRGAVELYDELSRAGFRRSHGFAYRPACPTCRGCVPVRIAVGQFAHSRSTRRVRNLNRDIPGRFVAARATPEQFHLFTAYQRSRHRDSDMAALSYGDYRSMVEDSAVRTALVEFRAPDGTLAAASLLDRLDDGYSAVYSFFDPARDKQSLGTWTILWLVEECRRQGLPYAYLGYWIGESPKMAYKARFPAIEHLSAAGWVPFPRTAP